MLFCLFVLLYILEMTDVETTTTTTTTKKPSVVEESTQYQHWRFSPQQLWDIRNERTKEAIDRVKRNMKEEMVFYYNTQ